MKRTFQKSLIGLLCLTVVLLFVYHGFLIKDQYTKVAQAFIIDGTEYDESVFPNVARLETSGGKGCTGTLIDPNHIITAAHCFYDGNENRDVLENGVDVRLNGKLYQSKKVYIHPNYKEPADYCMEGKTDAAIIELASKVSGVIPATLYTRKLTVGSVLTIAGYGLAGPGSDKGLSMEGYDLPPLGKIYAGTTAVEGFGLGPEEKNPASNYIYWTFGARESTTAPGDSGGPGFYNKELASITSCGEGNLLGGITEHTRIDILIPWINNVLAGKVASTPDPVQPPFVYDYDGLKFTFADSVTLSGYKLFMDTVEYNSFSKDDGTYNLLAFLGIYGDDSAMSFYDNYSQVPGNITMLYKKKGTSNYIEQLKTTMKQASHIAVKVEYGHKIAFMRDEIGSYDSPGPLVAPGEYTLSVFVNNKVVTSTDICLPSYTSKTGKKIGNVICSGTTSHSSVTTGTQPLDIFTANGPAVTQATQGENAKAYTVTIDDPIFIKSANNDLAQFNVPLLYGLSTGSTNTAKVSGSLQTVIYKKNELQKIEDTASLDSQNILFNTPSLYSYQWSGLRVGDEYVVYFYDKATGSKSSYVSLKYGSDGKLVATNISLLPPWAANLVLSVQGGTDNTGTNSYQSTGIQSSTDSNSNGVQAIFTITNANMIVKTGSDSKDTGTVTITGTVGYNIGVTPSKMNKVLMDLYDSKNQKITTKNINFTLANDNKGIAFTTIINNLDTTNSPFEFKIRDNDVNIQSDQFTIDECGTVCSMNQSSAWSAQNNTKVNGTEVSFADPTITPINNSSAMVSGSANYKNTTKSGKITDAKIALRLYNIDSTGKQTVNADLPIAVVPIYGQDTALSAKVSNLIAGQKYAVQFVDTAYNNATSSAKVIESKDGKFDLSDTQLPTITTADSSVGNQTVNGKTALEDPLKPGLNSIPAIVAAVVDGIVLPIAIPFLALAIIYTGFLFVRARGNVTKVEEAKKALMWTLIGGAVILGAYVIATAIQSTISSIVK